MRRERIRKNRRRLYLILTGIGAVVIFIGVFVWLVLRGAKVQGPTASSSATSISISSTVTSSFKSGTYTASGDVTDTNGDHHDLTVYVKLTSSKTYTRLMIFDAGNQPRIINDTGDIKQKKGKLTLSSAHANVYKYASAKTYKHNQPTTTVEYAAEGATGTVHDYTTALKKELNNTITLKGKTPHNYRYLTTSLPLQRSKKKLLSLDDFKTKQTASSSESSSTTSETSTYQPSQYSEPSSRVSVTPTPSTAPSVESEHSQGNSTGQSNGSTGNNGTSNNNGTENNSQPTPSSQASSQAPSPTQPASSSTGNSNS